MKAVQQEGNATQVQHQQMKTAKMLARRRKFKQNIPLLIMFAPIIAYFVIFKYVPMFGNIIAFKQYNFHDGILGSPWVGLQNFDLLFSNPQTINIIRNTFMLSVLGIIVGFPAPIILAVMMNELKNMIFKRSVQTLVYLPHFFSWVIVGGFVVMVFSQEGGIINTLYERWTGNAYPFLYNEGSWISIFLGSGIWKEAGFGAIIYLAALTSIDPALYEAANIDGANKFRQMWHITLPGIRPTIVLMFIINIGHVMEVGFDQVYMLQNSVVSNVSEVISTYIYKVGITGGQFSITAAMGLFESLIGLVLVLTANKIAKRYGHGLW